jgi:hypothetical protein
VEWFFPSSAANEWFFGSQVSNEWFDTIQHELAAGSVIEALMAIL